MPVTPDRLSTLTTSTLTTSEDCYEVLTRCYEAFLTHEQPRLVSLGFPLGGLDPLVVLGHVAAAPPHHFFFEYQDRCLMGLGKAIQFEVECRDRFSRTRAWIDEVVRHSLTYSSPAAPATGCRFFCNFSFFEQDKTHLPKAAVLLPRWQIEQHQGQTVAVVNVVFHKDFMTTREVHALWQEWQELRSLQWTLPTLAALAPQQLQLREIEPLQVFEQAVRSALDSIAAGHLDKVVLGRVLDVTAPQPFHVVGSLQALRGRYPDCYIFSTSCHGDQTFLGASPERLLQVSNGQLQTEALAGSAPRGQTDAEDLRFATQLLHSAKEAREHQLVIDFILQRLDQLGIATQVSLPRLLQLSNIQHRHTPIQGQVPAAVHVLDILAALHPTPAVAGFPRELACEQIRRYESFERGLFAAPIGWVDAQGNGEFAVGIRSALLQGNQARLFAGAGIVAGSDPAKELSEVQLKLQALLSTLC
jgi:menaquinone-specific isochorismate synthase